MCETGYSYQDANDAINAAIDYENNVNQPIKRDAPLQDDTDEDTDADTENVQVIQQVKELLDSQKVVKVKAGSSTLVTFLCCQCGFESANRVQLTAHMKKHTDVITKTLEIGHHKTGALLESMGQKQA